MPKKCSVPGCHAKAWHSDLCNLHALERHRGRYRPATSERLAQGKRLLRQRARELGIVLAPEGGDEQPARPSAVKGAVKNGGAQVISLAEARRKVRSPTG